MLVSQTCQPITGPNQLHVQLFYLTVRGCFSLTKTKWFDSLVVARFWIFYASNATKISVARSCYKVVLGRFSNVPSSFVISVLVCFYAKNTSCCVSAMQVITELIYRFLCYRPMPDRYVERYGPVTDVSRQSVPRPLSRPVKRRASTEDDGQKKKGCVL